MNKIINVLFFFLIAFGVNSSENLSTDKKTIKNILLEISDKIESLEKTFLLPDNGFIEDGDASVALVELDILRIKLKKLEGEIEKIEYNLSSKLNSINKNLEKISILLKKIDNTFELEMDDIKSNIDQIEVTKEKFTSNQFNDFESLKKAKIYIENAKYENAKVIFKNFIKNFPNSSLLPEVFFYFAESYYKTNEWKLAANSYLESFSLDPKGNFAPRALFGLAISLGALEQACLTLEEVNLRFPGQNDINSENINETMQLLECN